MASHIVHSKDLKGFFCFEAQVQRYDHFYLQKVYTVVIDIHFVLLKVVMPLDLGLQKIQILTYGSSGKS